MPEPSPSRNRRFADGLLVVLLLILTFLLGCFRQIDTDIWWHITAGREILRRGEVPHTDWFTFTSSDRPWIDLHWLFQITVAKLYSLGGMRLLTVCSATLGTGAVAILVAARRAGTSVVLQVGSMLPAIFLLTGRMYVRPEVVTLVCMAAFLTILFHADRHPRLLWLLLPIQVLWVNVQGLFVFGLVLYGFFWLDDLRRHATRSSGVARPESAKGVSHGIADLPRPSSTQGVPHGGRWKRSLFGFTLVAFCLLNPYGLDGLLFPFELFKKMSTDADFYSKHIAELQSLRQFIASAGIWHFYVLLHLALILAGATSFALLWCSKRFELFRFLTFAAFTWLSLQATRNSGQFALIVGAITAWNLADWASRGTVNRSENQDSTSRVGPLAMLIVLSAAIVWVASGQFFRIGGEGRLRGLDEQPFWHAHEAARFAAEQGMPDRMMAFHLGHAALFEFYKRDEQRTFADPRLEVVSREVLEEYHNIEKAIGENRRGWHELLARNGIEMLLVDHRGDHAVEATLLTDPDWRCVHFDPVASVFLRTETAGSRFPAVDFAAWHFEAANSAGRFTPKNQVPGDSFPWAPRLIGDQQVASEPIREFVVAEALYTIARDLHERGDNPDLKWTLAQVCFDYGRMGATLFPTNGDGWRFMALGLLLQIDDRTIALASLPETIFDNGSVAMLALARVKYLLISAWLSDPDDYATLSTLFVLSGLENDGTSQLLYAQKLLRRGARTKNERTLIEGVRSQFDALQRRAELEKAEAKTSSVVQYDRTLDERLKDHLSRGRTLATMNEVAPFAEEFEGPCWDGLETTPWPAFDLYAGLLLRFGAPDRARGVVTHLMAKYDDESLRQERIASTYLVECNYDAAIEHYQNSLALDTKRLGARWGLARSYLETGDAAGVVRETEAAIENVDLSFDRRRQLEWMLELARPFAGHD